MCTGLTSCRGVQRARKAVRPTSDAQPGWSRSQPVSVRLGLGSSPRRVRSALERDHLPPGPRRASTTGRQGNRCAHRASNTCPAHIAHSLSLRPQLPSRARRLTGGRRGGRERHSSRRRCLGGMSGGSGSRCGALGRLQSGQHSTVPLPGRCPCRQKSSRTADPPMPSLCAWVSAGRRMCFCTTPAVLYTVVCVLYAY